MGASKLAVEGAWDQSMGSPSIIIAIIDSGIDLEHDDLAPNLWINPGETAGNGLDDDNNAFIDDVQGWNFVDSTNEVQDYAGHGSLVAGVAAAKSNNNIGIAGVCGNCRILPVKVSQDFGVANYSDIALGVAYATQKGRMLSTSHWAVTPIRSLLRTPLTQQLRIISLLWLVRNDNSSSLFYPAAYDNVIAVAGTDQTTSRPPPPISVHGWMSALRELIFSRPHWRLQLNFRHFFFCALCIRAAGLLLSLHPEWTPAMIRSQFLHTSDNIDGLNPGFEGLLGKGRLNATLALQPPLPILTYQSYSANGVANFRPDLARQLI